MKRPLVRQDPWLITSELTLAREHINVTGPLVSLLLLPVANQLAQTRKCMACDIAFIQPDAMAIHKKADTAEMLHKCCMCDSPYSQPLAVTSEQ